MVERRKALGQCRQDLLWPIVACFMEMGKWGYACCISLQVGDREATIDPPGVQDLLTNAGTCGSPYEL